MKKFRILPLLLITVLAASVLSAPALAAEAPEIGAAAAVVVGRADGEVYYAKNEDQRVLPASTTKIMTAMLICEAVDRGDIKLTDPVTASENCQYNMDEMSSHADPAIKPGETMTVEDLLYCTMLASANEACNILAEYLSGSVEAFVAAMNARAKELGCTGTNFENCNGLEEVLHFTTAADFALIAREALKSPLFMQICGAASYTVPDTNMAASRQLENSNSLIIPDSDYYYDYAYGVKTGFFQNAGYCLVSAAEKDELDLICVYYGGAEKNSHFLDSMTLFDWVFSNYRSLQILSTGRSQVTVPVAMGTSDSVDLRAENAVSAVLPVDYDMSHINLQWVLYHEQEGRELTAPVSAGEALGEITVVEVDDSGNVLRTFGSSPLVAMSTVEMSRVEYLRSQISDLFRTPVVRSLVIVLVILLAAYALLVVFYNIQRTRHLRSLRAAKRDRALRQTQLDAEWLDIPGGDPDDGHPASYYDRGYREGGYQDDGYDDGYQDDGYRDDGYDDGYDDRTDSQRREDDEFFEKYFSEHE